MGQGNRPRLLGGPIDLAPPSNRACHPARGVVPVKMPSLGVLPDQKHQLDVRQLFEDALAPSLGAFVSRRRISSRDIVSRKAEAHWDDGDLVKVVKSFLVDPKPISQAHARRIGIGTAGGVDASAWCLTGDTDARITGCLYHRLRFMRQSGAIARCVAADTAGPKASKQQVKLCRHAGSFPTPAQAYRSKLCPIAAGCVRRPGL